MTITAVQIQLIRNSFAAVVPVTDAAARAFYGRLFTLAPDTRALFPTDLKAQGRKLFETLEVVVTTLDRFDELVPVARGLAIRHIDYGARPEHYRVVGAALLDTLRNALGVMFDRATEEAWEAAYDLLSSAMLAADAAERNRRAMR